MSDEGGDGGRGRSPSPRRRSPSPRRRSPSPRRRSPSPRRRSPSPPRRSPSPGAGGNKNFPKSDPRRFDDRHHAPRRATYEERLKPETSKVVGVFGLSSFTDERKLEDIFGKFGRLEKPPVIIKDRATDRSRGFGFITFEDIQDATDARDSLNGKDIDGRNVRVDYSITKRAHTPTPGIYKGQPVEELRRERERMGPPRGRDSYDDRRRDDRGYDPRSRDYDRRDRDYDRRDRDYDRRDRYDDRRGRDFDDRRGRDFDRDRYDDRRDRDRNYDRR